MSGNSKFMARAKLLQLKLGTFLTGENRTLILYCCLDVIMFYQFNCTIVVMLCYIGPRKKTYQILRNAKK